MAHFAKIENGVVTSVVVVDDAYEANGETYLNGLGLDGTWVQTSYSASLRGKFAGVGDILNEELDRFEPVKPYPSWGWDEQLYGYLPPFEQPIKGSYNWDEETLTWIEEPIA